MARKAMRETMREVRRATECPDDLRAGPFTVEYPGITPAGSEQEAADKAKKWFKDLPEDQQKRQLAVPSCSGGGLVDTPSCAGFECEDGECVFDYEISKATAVELKPAGKTAKFKKPTKARYKVTLEIWWGCFCVETV